jgi:glycosyltransferase involved in cell wall biosynthesis
VSAAIAVRDGERFLAEAIESTLAQTVPCSEVIVIDNGSTDQSREIAESYGDAGVRVVEEPEAGIARARNAALAAYRGTHLSFLDADDLWEPRKNEVQLAALTSPDPPEIVFGHVVQFREGADGQSQPQRGLLVASLAAREAWDRIGRWPTEVANTAEGLDFILRVRRAGLREMVIDDVVQRRRIHGENVGVRERETRTDMARVMKRELDRRRAEAG